MGDNTGDNGLNSCRDVMGYQEPTGPKNRHRPGPGLRGGTVLRHGLQGKNISYSTADGDGGSGSETDLNTEPTLLGGAQRG